MGRKRVVWLLGIVGLALLSGGWVLLRRGGDATPVEVAKVGREDLQAKVTANGKVQAQKRVDVSALIAGQITRLAVKEGDRVHRGQFLLQIDQVNPRAMARGNEASMLHGFLRTLVKVAVASLIVGTILAHFGITTDQLIREFGLSQDRIMELARQGVTWALPNLLLGSLVIVPVWFVIYLFRPPRSE